MASKRGRPKIVFDLEEVRKMGYNHATYETMAYLLDCSEDCIRSRMRDPRSDFYKAYKKGMNDMKMKLAEAQINSAIEGKNITMQIWLGKNYLGQTENPLGDEEDDVSALFDGWDD